MKTRSPVAIRRLAVRVLVLGLALAGMEGPHAQGTRFGKGAGPGAVLDFGARCSEPGHSWGGYWQAYGHFASADGRAQVLARILVGRIGVQSGVRIAAALEDVVIRTGRGGMEVAFRLEGSGIRGGEAQASAWSTRYRASPRDGGYPEPWAYETNAQGELRWSRFPRKGSAEERHAHPETLELDARSWDARETVRLRMWVRTGEGEAPQALDGPALKEVGAYLGLELQETKELGLAETLDPTEKGGLWGWFRHAYRYRDCHEWREAARAAFYREADE